MFDAQGNIVLYAGMLSLIKLFKPKSQKTVSTNHNLFEEKGEPKRYRTEVLPLTSLTPYR